MAWVHSECVILNVERFVSASSGRLRHSGLVPMFAIHPAYRNERRLIHRCNLATTVVNWHNHCVSFALPRSVSANYSPRENSRMLKLNTWLAKGLKRGDLHSLRDVASGLRPDGLTEGQAHRLGARGMVRDLPNGHFRVTARGKLALLIRRFSVRH